MTSSFDATEQVTLAALTDVFVPAVRPPAAQAGDPHGFWALRASDTGTPDRVAAALPGLVSDDELEGLRTLLAVLRRAGVGRVPQSVAQALLAGLARADAQAGEAIDALRALTMMAHYGGVDQDGSNRTWAQLGYPGPPAVSDERPPPALYAPEVDEVRCDVVVVGSGAGGGVMAATLAAEGVDVVVLEAGAPASGHDLPDDEAGALQRLYWRGGLVTTDDGNVAVLAGGTLGGGTTVNWSNCVPPPEHVRAEWAAAGLDGVEGAELDEHLAAVATRIGVNDDTPANRPNEALRDGAKALGWEWHPAGRNVDTGGEDPRASGLTGHGDRAGAKNGSLATWLRDAVDAGARVVVGARVERVEASGGRATGVTATLTDPDGTTRTLRVRADDVVLACGALETPAVLLRSGLGGPAVGRNLRLHPVPILPGVYPEPQQAWWGPPQGVVVGERSVVAEGHGYLLETPHWHPGLTAASIAWPDARDHKVLMGRLERMSTFIAVTRERGGGSVTLDDAGEAVVRYPLDDPFDRWLLQQAVRDLVRLHVAAGADAIVDLAPGRDVWRRGEDVEGFGDQIAAKPLGADGRVLFSAHQMGSARMGSDPGTSVADPDGRLHDVSGVWIGDTSAFPTAVGSNPMLTCMALARRTATRLLATRST